MTPAAAAEVLKQKFGVEATVDTPGGGTPVVTARLSREQWQAAAAAAKAELGCLYFNWLSAIDWKEQGLEVLCRLDDLEGRWALMLRTPLPAGDVHCPTLAGIYRGADWMERECYDLLGVVFDGHPDLRRILLGQDWVGHPLRKDYVDMDSTPYR